MTDTTKEIRKDLARLARWHPLEFVFWAVALATVFVLPGRYLILTEIAWLALFALSLLWLGAGLSRATLQSISFRPLLFAVLLWLLLAGFSLFAIEVMT